MRIEKIKLNNYRQFRNFEIELKKEKDSDLHVIIARNGTCKTNLLNAINWCLYGDEPHHSRDSQQLPILNLNSILEAEDGESLGLSAEVIARSNDNKCMVFSRRTNYNIYKNEKEPVQHNCEFEVKIEDDKGNTKIHGGEEAESYVERFVPKRIREFFFFDGERLDNYFKEATGQNIRNAVFKISQIDLLDRIEDRLGKILQEFRKGAGKYSPAIEAARNELETKEKDLKATTNTINDCNTQISKSKEKIKEYEEKLKGIPDVNVLESKRSKLKNTINEKEQIRSQKISEKHNFLFEQGKRINLYPSINKALQLINLKRVNKEIPPQLDPSLLSEIIKENCCSVCGRELDDTSKEKVQALISEVTSTTTIGRILLDIENPLLLIRERTDNFEDDIKNITHEVMSISKDLTAIESEIAGIDKELSGYDIEKVNAWHKERKVFEEIHDEKQQQLGQLNAQKKTQQDEVAKLKADLDHELRREGKAKKLKKDIDFCEKALGVVTLTKDHIMHQVREKIEHETRELFFNLLWKQETFKDVSILEDYNIKLTHSSGYECLGSTSAAERELLALSFTLALHKVSGFDSPILIDTPVARISDEHRENFGEIFSEVSKDKQIILLFTPAEYSEDISRSLDLSASNRFSIRLSSDEKETILEG